MTDPAPEPDYTAITSSFSESYECKPLDFQTIKEAVKKLKAMEEAAIMGQIGKYFGVNFVAAPRVCACGHYEVNHAPRGECVACLPNCVSFAEDNLDWLIRRDEYRKHQNTSK